MELLQNNKLLKKERLLKKSQFDHVFSSTNYRIKSNHLRVTAIPNKTLPRLGITVPKKNIKLAVTRNKIKRLIREHYRKRKNTLPLCDIIVHIHKKIEDEQIIVLNQELDYLWETLQRISNKPPKVFTRKGFQSKK